MLTRTTRRHPLRRAILLAGVVLTVAPAGAQRAPGAMPEGAPSTILVRGLVRAPDGRPVSNAIVRVTQHIGTLIGLTASGADGRFVIAAPDRLRQRRDHDALGRWDVAGAPHV